MDCSRHSNILETRAAFLALQAFAHLIQHKSVLLQMDNKTTVSYIRRQGGTRSSAMLKEVTSIMDWAQSHLLSLSAMYLPGDQNVLADVLSRATIQPHEWGLNQEVFNSIIQTWGLVSSPIIASRQLKHWTPSRADGVATWHTPSLHIH